MRKPRVTITPEIVAAVIADYTSLSLPEVASKNNLSWMTARDILKRNNIPIHDRSQLTQERAARKNKKTSDRDQDIVKLYLENVRISDITKQYKTRAGTIRNIINRYNIPKRQACKPTVKAHETSNQEVKDKLYDLYVTNAYSLTEVGKILNKSTVCISDWLGRIGIPTRSIKEATNTTRNRSNRKNHFLQKFGVENPMQCADVYLKSNTSRYKFKDHTFNGRKFTQLQGYEPQAIEYLVNEYGIGVDHILTGKLVPTIPYTHNGKNRRYFPDFYVKDTNTLYEIKSTYTYTNMIELNKIKRQAALDAGYNHITIIFKQGAKEIDQIF